MGKNAGLCLCHPKGQRAGVFLSSYRLKKSGAVWMPRNLPHRGSRNMNEHTINTLSLLSILEEENENLYECLADDIIDDDEFDCPELEQAYQEFFEAVQKL